MRNPLRGWTCRRKGHKWFPNFTSEVFPITSVCLRCPEKKTEPPTNHPGWEKLFGEIEDEIKKGE
jgi:hypothetical protein